MGKCGHCKGTGKTQLLCCFYMLLGRKPSWTKDGCGWEVKCCACNGSGTTQRTINPNNPYIP